MKTSSFRENLTRYVGFDDDASAALRAEHPLVTLESSDRGAAFRISIPDAPAGGAT